MRFTRIGLHPAASSRRRFYESSGTGERRIRSGCETCRQYGARVLPLTAAAVMAPTRGAYANGLLRALVLAAFSALSRRKPELWQWPYVRHQRAIREDVSFDLLLVIGAIPDRAGSPMRAIHQSAAGSRTQLIVMSSANETRKGSHLAVRPGAELFSFSLCWPRCRPADHTRSSGAPIGFAEVRQVLFNIPLAEWAAAADISIADLIFAPR